MCATPTPRIEILSEKPLNAIYSAGVSVVSTLPLTLTPTVPLHSPLRLLALIDSAEFSLHYTEAILLPLNVVIAPSLGKNIFLGRAQFFLG